MRDPGWPSLSWEAGEPIEDPVPRHDMPEGLSVKEVAWHNAEAERWKLLQEETYRLPASAVHKLAIKQTDPYRSSPYVTLPQPGLHDRWFVHPFAWGSSCRFCDTNGMHVTRRPRCFGKRSWWLWGAWLCPRKPHHHVRCGYCKRDWCEETGDAANLAT